ISVRLSPLIASIATSDCTVGHVQVLDHLSCRPDMAALAECGSLNSGKVNILNADPSLCQRLLDLVPGDVDHVQGFHHLSSKTDSAAFFVVDRVCFDRQGSVHKIGARDVLPAVIVDDVTVQYPGATVHAGISVLDDARVAALRIIAMYNVCRRLVVEVLLHQYRGAVLLVTCHKGPAVFTQEVEPNSKHVGVIVAIIRLMDDFMEHGNVHTVFV